MPDSRAIKPPRRQMRWGLYLPFILLGMICLGWTGVWFYAAGEVNRSIDAWLEDQRQQGTQWTCPERKLEGFPFRIEFSCQEPTYAADAGNGAVLGKISALNAVALAYQPDRVIAQLDSPLSLRLPNGGGEVQMTWQDFRVSLAGLPGSGAHADIAVRQPAVQTITGGTPLPRGGAQSAELHLRRNPDRPAADRAVDLALSISEITSDALNAMAQSAQPANVSMRATLTQARPGNDETLAQWLEIWRQAGGLLDIAATEVSKGEMKISGSGQVGLDEAHRVQGQTSINAAGMEPILARFGIPAATMNVGGLLSGLIGGKPKGGAAPGNGLQLSFALQNGKVTMGPLKLPVTLVPLY